jgi:1A family penicillin-binding protein
MTAKILFKNKKPQIKSWWWKVGILIFIGLVTYGTALVANLPSPEEFEGRKISESTKLYDRTGEHLLYEIHGDEKRTILPFSEIPKYIKDAVLAAEDAGFYTEPAFNWKGILRAVLANLQSGQLSQGGSTISQQLARNIFLTPEKTITRKIKELALAIELERRYSKEEIFSLYLNQIPLGSNVYGVEAASKLYFGKSAKDLNVKEAATLAAMVQAPSYYSPWGKHLTDLNYRVDYVLDRMNKLGWLKDEDLAKAKKDTVIFAEQSLTGITAPHFSLWIKDQLIEKYGEYEVLHGGLKITTSLDIDLQKIAEKAVADGAKRNEELYSGTNAALVAEDPSTGEILAMVGSRDYFDKTIDGKFNVPVQGLRQPGSALKPFVYLSAFQKGYSPKTILFDAETEFDTRGSSSYKPQNFDEKFPGPVSMEKSLAESRNVPAVQTLYLVGIPTVLKNLSEAGITTLQDPSRYGLSLTLGGGEVKMIELVGAYSTLAQDGIWKKQISILKIEDSLGRTIEESKPEEKRVFGEQETRLINQVLSTPELRSGVFQSSLPLTVFPGHQVALKTGTTQDYRDAWTFGYTPRLAVGVWAGNNDNKPMQKRGSSLLAAVPIWNAFLSEVLKKIEPQGFNSPDPLNLPNKPMLNGEAYFNLNVGGKLFPQAHSILFYVDKNDPLGPIPVNPGDDSQFLNWEEAVTNWMKENSSNPSVFNQLPSGLNSFTNPNINIYNLKPQNGQFIKNSFQFEATLNSPNVIQNISLNWNGKTINTVRPFSPFYQYKFTINEPNLQNQNTLELIATDNKNQESKQVIILFKDLQKN